MAEVVDVAKANTNCCNILYAVLILLEHDPKQSSFEMILKEDFVERIK